MDNYGKFCQDGMCNDGIMLEPRLMEYLRKQNFNYENNIEPTVPLEKTYQISSDDKRRIKKFLKGKKDIYSLNSLSKDSTFLDVSKNKMTGFDNDLNYVNDPRFERIKKKAEKNKNAMLQKDNHSNLFEKNKNDDDFLKSEFNYHKEYRNNNYYKPNNDTYLLNSKEEDYIYENPYYQFNREKKPEMMYNNVPKINRNRLIPTQIGSSINSSNPHNPEFDTIMNKFNSFENNDYQKDFNKFLDKKSNKIEPIQSMNNKERKNEYIKAPIVYKDNRDINSDSFLRYGVNSRASKSVGYENPVEHYFQYIDPEIQDPRFVVNDRGIPSRSFNKKIAKPYLRDIV